MVKSDKWLKGNASRLGIEEGLINPNSVDLRLGGHIIEYTPIWVIPEEGTLGSGTPTTTKEKVGFSLNPNEAYTFLPNHFYLCHSIETITMPKNKVGLVALKSTSARKGIDLTNYNLIGLHHLNAGFIDAGFEGQITFEFVVHLPVTVKVGNPICQLVYIDAELPILDYSETGRYQNQAGATPARRKRDA